MHWVGDDAAWAMEDWAWDGKSFTAVPAAGAIRPTKRLCSGAERDNHTGVQNIASVPQSPCCRGSQQTCGAAEEVFDLISVIQEEQEFSPDGSPDSSKIGSAVTCQVEECSKDLSRLSVYYQRCRICEVHIKQPQFLRAGKVQRFCQQCGRCHELSAFQGSKRSCKDQLAKHNARRRRRQDGKKLGSHQVVEGLPSSTPCQSRVESALTAFLGPHASRQSSGSDGFAIPGVPMPTPSSLATERQQHDLLTQLLPANSPLQSVESQQFELDGGLELPENLGVAVGIPVQDFPRSSQCLPAKEAEGSSFATALAMMSSQPKPDYESNNLVVRLSVKLFNATPADLPTDLKQQLTGWLKSTPAGAEGYLRPGCVHLTLQAVVPAPANQQRAEGGLRDVAAHLMAQPDPVWASHVALLDLDGQLGLMKHGQLLSCWDLASDPSTSEGEFRGLRPQLWRATPAAHVGPDSAAVRLWADLAATGAKVLCRAAGSYVEVTCQPGGASGGRAGVEVGLPPGLEPGLAWLELQVGCLLSRPAPLLLCPSQALAAELQGFMTGVPETYEALLVDIGLLMASRGTPNEGLAAKLAEFACKANLPELLALVVSLDPPKQLLAPESDSFSLLHVCLQHSSTAALTWLLANSHLQVTHPGPRGVTPLHLAALQKAGGAATQLLLSHSPPGSWTSCAAADGLTPADFAHMAGNYALEGLLLNPNADPGKLAVGGGQQDFCTVLMESESDSEGAPEEQQQLLPRAGLGFLEGSCTAWPGPIPRLFLPPAAEKWSKVALLGTVACMCTSFVLLQGWV